MAQKAAIQVEGAKQLRRALTDMGDDSVDEMRVVNLEGVEMVLGTALTRVPVRTGKLKATVRGSATKTRGTIRAGKKKVPYAGVVHFGNPHTGIEPNMFLYDAIDARRDEVITVYENFVQGLKRKHNL